MLSAGEAPCRSAVRRRRTRALANADADDCVPARSGRSRLSQLLHGASATDRDTSNTNICNRGHRSPKAYRPRLVLAGGQDWSAQQACRTPRAWRRSPVAFRPCKPGARPVPTNGKAATLKVTIDSSEPLEDAVRVLSAIYQVRLTVADAAAAEEIAPTEPARKAPSSRPGKSSTRRAESTRDQASQSTRVNRNARTRTASPSELRDWARSQGLTVSDRGRVPDAIVAAYRAAQRS